MTVCLKVIGSCIFYYSVETRIAPMCDSGSYTSTGESLYLQNFNYPDNQIRSSDTRCTCSVEARSCSSQIKVYFVHFQLYGGEGCPEKQKIVINDDGNVHEYTCSNNTGYEITSIFTSSSNYLTVTLDNPDNVAGGYFWIAFEGKRIFRQGEKHVLGGCDKARLKLICLATKLHRSLKFRLSNSLYLCTPITTRRAVISFQVIRETKTFQSVV